MEAFEIVCKMAYVNPIEFTHMQPQYMCLVVLDRDTSSRAMAGTLEQPPIVFWFIIFSGVILRVDGVSSRVNLNAGSIESTCETMHKKC